MCPVNFYSSTRSSGKGGALDGMLPPVPAFSDSVFAVVGGVALGPLAAER